jgi:suppressor of G2 allele of SKP1
MGGDKDTDTGPNYYSKGNEAFVAENYQSAIDLYTSALNLEPPFVDCLVARAHAYIKAEKFELAKKDADKAIDIIRASSDSASPVAAKAFLRSGVASFHLGRYKEAKNSFLEGQKLGEEAGLKQWMAWCDEKIKKFGDNAPGVKTADPEPAESKVKTSSNTSSKEDAQPTAAPSSYDPSAMPTPKISHDWYQTETTVVVEVRIKKLSVEQVQVEIHPTSLSVTAKLPVGSEYSLELDLAHPVTPEQSSYKILSTKLEIKLRKAEGVRWSSLEGDGSTPLPGGALPSAASTSGVRAPYASGRDWAAIEKNLAAEAEEKKEGEAALNEMFQKIYGDANDDVKRAMNKSFQESGGTVLSTNWSEIGKEKTEVKPPDGMEWKKYD